MVAAVASNINPKTAAGARGAPRHTANPTRPPLLPSESDNALAPRRPRAREVTSRYMCSSSSGTVTPGSRRCPSPLVSRTPAMTTTPAVKRPQSAERRRAAATPRGSGDLDIGIVSAAQRMLFASARSVSVSFQGESFSLPVSKVKQAPLASQTPSSRKGTPERRRSAASPAKAADRTENSKPVEQHRWPGRLREPNALSRSVDFTDERRKIGGSENVVRALQNSMVDDRSHRHGGGGGLTSNSSNADLEKVIEVVCESNSGVGSNAASDSETVSSGSSSSGIPGVGGGGGGGHGRRAPRGIEVPARFLQENNNRLRRHPEPESPGSKNTGFKSTVPTKLIVSKNLANDCPSSAPRGVLNSRGHSSPIRTPIRHASPSKLAMTSASSAVRGMSPLRARNSSPGKMSSNVSNNAPSILSFAVDIRRGKVGESRIGDAHQLRLLYNRAMQLRFVNARAESLLSTQKLNVEKSLYTAWVSTSKRRDSVRAKRVELQSLSQKLKLTSILSEQMPFLEDWALMDHDYCSSLLGAIEALRASILRLPVVGGARADIQKVKDAISSAVDVMQAMASSVHLLSLKVVEVQSLAAELANVSAKEQASLGRCKDLLSVVASMQVQDCSLRTHMLQHKRQLQDL